jgi:hypothetical protein
MSHVEGSTSGDDTMSNIENHGQQSDAAAASAEARQRRRIAQLEEKLEVLESGRAAKDRYGFNYKQELASLTICQAIELLHGSREGNQAHHLSIR